MLPGCSVSWYWLLSGHLTTRHSQFGGKMPLVPLSAVTAQPGPAARNWSQCTLGEDGQSGFIITSFLGSFNHLGKFYWSTSSLVLNVHSTDWSHHQLRDGITLKSLRLSCSPRVQCQQPGPGSASGAVHNHLIGHQQHLERSDWSAGSFPVLRLVQDQCLSWCQLQPNWLFLTVINQEFLLLM